MAVAHALAKVVYFMLKFKIEYEDIPADEYQKSYEEQQLKYLQKTCVEPVETKPPNSACSSFPASERRGGDENRLSPAGDGPLCVACFQGKSPIFTIFCRFALAPDVFLPLWRGD